MIHRRVLHSAAAAITVVMATAGQACAGGLTLAHPYRAGGTVDAWTRELATCVEDVTGIYLEVIGGGELGRPLDLANAVADGLIDMAALPAWALEKRWPEVSGLAQPGQVYDPKDMMRLSDSPAFIETLNSLGGLHYNVELVAIGWQHALLVGARSGLEGLQGKKLSVRDATVIEALERAGANPISIPPSEVLPALQYGAVDGAIVDVELVRRGLELGGVEELKWSPDFAPFASPVVVLMSAATVEAFGKDIPSQIRTECLHVTHNFNVRTIDDIASLAKDANVLPVSEAEREIWRETFGDVRASRLGSDDPVGNAVREALRQ